MSRGSWLGFIFFVALVMLGFATLLVGNLRLFGKPIGVKVHFPSVEGLRPGDDVRVDGIMYGKVEKIDLNQLDGVDVDVRLDKAVTIFQDHKIEIEASSVLGGSVVSISRGKKEPYRPLKEGELLLGTVRPGLQQIGDRLQPLLTNLTDITQNLKTGQGTIPKLLNTDEMHKEMVATLKGAQETIAEIKKDVAKVAEKLDKGEGPLPALLNDKKMTQKLDAALDNVSKTSDNLKKFSEKLDSKEGVIGRLLTDKEMADKLKNTLDNIDKSAESIKNITGTLDQKITDGEGTLGKIIQDDELYEKARKAVDDIDKVLGRAARAVVEIAGESKLYDDSQVQISKLGIKIRLGIDAATGLEEKYFYVGAAFMGLDREGEVLFDTLIEDNESDTIIKGEIQLAYRVPWFLDRRMVIRAGLIEGLPGGGVDIQWENWGLFTWPVQLTFEFRDAYNDVDHDDIDEGIDGPMLRFFAKAPIWTDRDTWWGLLLSTVRVYGGVSRIGEDPEGIIGIGLEWPDDDIRSLISLLGLAR